MISFNLCLVVVLVRKRKLYLNVRRDCNVYLHPETVYLHPKTVLISTFIILVILIILFLFISIFCYSNCVFHKSYNRVTKTN